MRILITGGHGFIGKHIVLGLSGLDYEVTVLDCQPPPSDLASVDYYYIQGDVLDMEHLRKAWASAMPEIVVHLVGLADGSIAQRDPERSFQLNVVATERVLEACRLQPVERVIVPSTAAVYGITRQLPVAEETSPSPTTIYGWHKWITEVLVLAYARCYGVPYTILRLFNVYGRGHRGVIDLALRSARNHEPLALFGADQLRDFVYARDVVTAFLKAIETPGVLNKTLNIGSGEGLSIREVVAYVQELYPDLQVMYEDGRSDTLYDSVADMTLARRLLGWKPRSPRELMAEVIGKEMLCE